MAFACHHHGILGPGLEQCALDGKPSVRLDSDYALPPTMPARISRMMAFGSSVRRAPAGHDRAIHQASNRHAHRRPLSRSESPLAPKTPMGCPRVSDLTVVRTWCKASGESAESAMTHGLAPDLLQPAQQRVGGF